MNPNTDAGNGLQPERLQVARQHFCWHQGSGAAQAPTSLLHRTRPAASLVERVQYDRRLLLERLNVDAVMK